MQTSSGGNADTGVLGEQSCGSPTRSYQPRKKLEKLNYKVGASILEIYKERNKAKLDEASINPQEIILSKIL